MNYRRVYNAWQNGRLIVENPFQSIQAIQTLLHHNRILTIVIGAIAVSVWGEPRLTRDIDMKINANRGDTDTPYDVIAIQRGHQVRSAARIVIADVHTRRFDPS